MTTEYVLEGLYPNTLYHIWLAAKSKRGEGATTPPVAIRTEQYGKWTVETLGRRRRELRSVSLSR